MRKKYEDGGLQAFFDESAFIDATEDEKYQMPFKWSCRLITAAALAGSMVVCYSIYEVSTYTVTPLIEHEIENPTPSSSATVAPSPSDYETPSSLPSNTPTTP
jgi:hypothetical protein